MLMSMLLLFFFSLSLLLYGLVSLPPLVIVLSLCQDTSVCFVVAFPLLLATFLPFSIYAHLLTRTAYCQERGSVGLARWRSWCSEVDTDSTVGAAPLLLSSLPLSRTNIPNRRPISHFAFHRPSSLNFLSNLPSIPPWILSPLFFSQVL